MRRKILAPLAKWGWDGKYVKNSIKLRRTQKITWFDVSAATYKGKPLGQPPGGGTHNPLDNQGVVTEEQPQPIGGEELVYYSLIF